VEVRGCSSSPEILELKAQCEVALYRGAAASRLQCPFGLAGPVSKSFQDIFVEGVINCLSCNHPDTQSAVFRNHSSHNFHILIICCNQKQVYGKIKMEH